MGVVVPNRVRVCVRIGRATAMGCATASAVIGEAVPEGDGLREEHYFAEDSEAVARSLGERQEIAYPKVDESLRDSKVPVTE